MFGENFGEAIGYLIFRCCTPQKETQQDCAATLLQAVIRRKIQNDAYTQVKGTLITFDRWQKSAVNLAIQPPDRNSLQKNISS